MGKTLQQILDERKKPATTEGVRTPVESARPFNPKGSLGSRIFKQKTGKEAVPVEGSAEAKG